ncbi:MAG: hypothetical protein VXV96_18085 [Bdellovibrionota bacterium]|nr:hypothetical protein [Bdellovibrionota bacterium]
MTLFALLFSTQARSPLVDLKVRKDAIKRSRVKAPPMDPKLEAQIKDSFFDPNYDYSEFTGRVTDRDDTNSLVKVSSENGNIKFFRSGDLVRFRLASQETRQCRGYVRSVEKNFFVLYIQDISICWGKGEYFRRGSLLVFNSSTLAARVRDASTYRIVLLKRKRDFYKQLNDINHFVWSYEQEKMKVAAEYDEKITALRQAKQKALDMMITKKQDSINLQRELGVRLDELDKDIEFYRIDKDDPKIDRWHLDHDLGKPVAKRPKRNYFAQ